MFYLFLCSKPGDTYLQSCASLPDCQKVVEEKIEQLRSTYGTRKARFYALDHSGEIVVGWVMETRKE